MTRGGRLWLNAVCQTATGSAAPSLRLARFIGALGGPTASACDGPGYHAAMQRLAASIAAAR